jgi:hypothetical protein
MQAITTIGLDIAKSVFQVGIDGEGKVIIAANWSVATSWHFSRSCRRASWRTCARSAGSTLKDHRDEAITHTGRIVSIALILTKQ